MLRLVKQVVLKDTICSHARYSSCKKNVSSSADIRSSFIDFFQEKQNHEHIPSSKVFLAEDRNINFVCAGMNQFKPVFLGKASPDFNVKRAVNSQRCIRAGGKHNDLDAVGYDYTHHTFFEMLGSWSFNDYFKEEACAMAWTLLTEVYCLSKDQLYITYFGGSDYLNLKPDLETKEIWLSLGVPENRILPFGTGDNFWDMGATGPCGPCTEIHYDRIPGRYNPTAVNIDGSDVVEIWNLVFMQFNRLESQRVEPLATLNVDTGMGLERVSAVLQGVTSNYDTDVFTPILRAIQEICNCEAYTGRLDCERDVAYRIISDHIRMLTVSIADGLIPGATGSGLILRRVLRRAVLAGKNNLGAPDDFLKHLVPVVVDYLKPTYPGLQSLQNDIMTHVQEAEGIFADMIKCNDLVIDQSLAQMNLSQIQFPFKLAKKLYYHDGYPIDRFQSKVESIGKKLDVEGLEKLHYESENYMKNKTKGTLNNYAVSTLLSRLNIGSTILLESEESVNTQSVKIMCVCTDNGEVVPNLEEEEAEEDTYVYVVLDQSFSIFDDMKALKKLGNLTIDGTSVNIEKVLHVDGWVLHKVTNSKILHSNSTSVVKLNQNKELSEPFLRAQKASIILEQIFSSYSKQHALLKSKVRDDKLIFELAGVVEEKLISDVIEKFRNGGMDEFSSRSSRESHLASDDICCIKSKRSAGGRTVLTVLVGQRASDAHGVCSDLQTKVDSIKISFNPDGDIEDGKTLKKVVGRVKNEVNSSEIPLQDKHRLLNILQDILAEVKLLKKDTNHISSC